MRVPILYLRTSTKDQNPELQREEGVEFSLNLGLGEPEVYSEQGSAYKLEKVRPVWESVVEKAKKESRPIIIWKYDRTFRNREQFYKFMKVMFEVYNIKVYSVTEPSILKFWEMLDKSYSDNPIFNELINNLFKTMWDFLIQMTGEAAEEESKKKSQRIKLAVRKNKGKTTSYKGKKWGRKAINARVVKEIIFLREKGDTIRRICQQVYYYDKNNNKKQVSPGLVHKILKENNVEKGKLKGGSLID